MKTEILFILDRSGSMASIAEACISGFNTFLKEQQAVPGEARATLALFDNVYELCGTAGRDLRLVEPLTEKTFVPRSNTALFDAIGRTLSTQGERIAAEIEHAQKVGWQFVFLAANQDAWETAELVGMSTKYAQTYDANPAGAASAFRTASVSTTAIRGGK